MGSRLVRFFESVGEENTEETIKSAVDRAEEGDIKTIIVASTSGKTSVRVAEQLRKRGLGPKVICVSGPPSWKKFPEYKFPLIKESTRRKMDEMGIRLINDVEEPFRPITFRNWWEKKTVQVPRPESDLFWMTLICVGGHGFRTAIEVVFMTEEAKAINTGEMVISVAGTATGADTAIVMKTSKFEDAVSVDPEKRMKIREILAIPKETRWIGYG
jgi:hypothetical protein